MNLTRKITTEWVGGMSFVSDNTNGTTLLMDSEAEENDKLYGLSPKGMMLSALAGCSGIDIVMVLGKMKIKDYKLKMDVVGELTEEHPKYFHKVKIDYHFYGQELNEKKFKKAVDLSVEKYCGVMEMFRRFAEMDIRIHMHEA